MQPLVLRRNTSMSSIFSFQRVTGNGVAELHVPSDLECMRQILATHAARIYQRSRAQQAAPIATNSRHTHVRAHPFPEQLNSLAIAARVLLGWLGADGITMVLLQAARRKLNLPF